ncbi:MAG: hypothetical protein DWQ30_16260 [Acidobacteria bacterium]|nr:MAG: hypothetical protein DWQ30_16260 [Acidobacteriota bacterium]
MKVILGMRRKSSKVSGRGGPGELVETVEIGGDRAITIGSEAASGRGAPNRPNGRSDGTTAGPRPNRPSRRVGIEASERPAARTGVEDLRICSAIARMGSRIWQDAAIIRSPWIPKALPAPAAQGNAGPPQRTDARQRRPPMTDRHPRHPNRRPGAARTAPLATVAIATTWLLASLAAAQPSPTGVYLVWFGEPGLVHYEGGVDGLEATSPRARGERRFDARAAASVAYRQHLQRRQDLRLDAIEAELGRSVDVPLRYYAARSGVAVRMSESEAARVAGLAGVLAVVPDRLDPLDTDRGPIWIGADTIHDGSSTGGLGATEGEGVIVGVIDSGVNMDHPSFANPGDDGHVFTNPFGSGTYVGWCDPLNPNYSPSYLCNDKLIGAWDFVDALVATESDGPEDSDGHGSHTASTSAGNDLSSPDIQGVAPHANLITYDTCYVSGTQGLCPFAATSAAVDQAILDGVDVINYSISGGTSPWSLGDIDSFFRSAVAAGVFVSASAGNSGPGASTVAHWGPWVTTVGASTHDLVTVENGVVSMSGGATLPPADLSGASRTGGYGPATIVYAGDFSNGDPDPEQCLNPFPAGTWNAGEIVLCDRGTIARVLKCKHVADGGAGGCVLGNTTPATNTTVPDPHVIPASHVDLAWADQLRTWLASGSGHTATITAGAPVVDAAIGDVMASFSSRGPAGIEVIKPDVTNPGVSIFAAVADDAIPGAPGPEFGILSGTSMSSPHTAGSGALIRALHPTWTPPEVKSALMLTAKTADVRKENGVTPADPYDRGNGRVDLTVAARAGFVLDETDGNFLAANPGAGGDPSTLNLASLRDNTCAGSCSWTRTVRNRQAASVEFAAPAPSSLGPGFWLQVSPTSFTLAPGATQVLEFTISVTEATAATTRFFDLPFTSLTGGTPDAHFSAAIVPTGVDTSFVFADGFESGDTSAWSSTIP